MKKFKITSYASLILAGFILTSPINAEAKISIDELYEEAYEDLENGLNPVNKTERIKNDDKTYMEKEVISYNEDILLGDIVEVNGIGNSKSCGSGHKSCEFNNEAMAVVGIKEDSEYPYALASVSSTGKVGHIVAWFKESSIKSRNVSITYKEYADAIKEIISSDGMIEQIGMIYIPEEDMYIPEYTANFYAGLKGYRLYDNDHMIKISFDFDKSNIESDKHKTLKFDGDVETHEFVKDGDYFYYYYNWETGEITHKEEKRDTVSNDIKTLNKVFNITNK